MILFRQEYSVASELRQAELTRTRQINSEAGVFECIHDVHPGDKRLTFEDLFEIGDRQYADQICVVANSDISFDQSLRTLKDLVTDNVLIALTRWDNSVAPSMEGTVEPRDWKFYSHSQDVWVFRGRQLPGFRKDFVLGMPRCENRLLYEAYQAGVKILNPALSVKAMHHHASAVRSWVAGDFYRGCLYFPRLTTLATNGPEGLIARGQNLENRTIVGTDGLERAWPARSGKRRKWYQRIRLRTPVYLKNDNRQT